MQFGLAPVSAVYAAESAVEGAGSGPPQPAMLILRSYEHDYWDYPRELLIRGVYPGPGSEASYARAETTSDSEFAPKHLALVRRDGKSWGPPPVGGEMQVAIWHFADDHDVWIDDVFHPPTPNPDAWATVRSSDLAVEMADWQSRHPRQTRG